jgi:hypothetical protein
MKSSPSKDSAKSEAYNNSAIRKCFQDKGFERDGCDASNCEISESLWCSVCCEAAQVICVCKWGAVYELNKIFETDAN